MTRRRLSREQARDQILDTALRHLREHGPQALKLTVLAKEIGVSHQAILHHFGSRDGLVAAVVRRAVAQLQAELIGGLSGLDDRERGSAVLLDRAFEILVDEGHGRLLAWLALSHPNEVSLDAERPLELLAKAGHSVRERDLESEVDHSDTLFTFILISYAVLGAAVFQKGVFASAGLGDDAEAPERFRAWLRALVVGHLERQP